MRYKEDPWEYASEEECATCGDLYDCVPPWYYKTCKRCRNKAMAKNDAARAVAEAERTKIRDAMTAEVRP